MKIIKDSQYWIAAEDISDIEEFKNRFTFKSKYKDNDPVPTYTYKVEDGVEYYGFPRNSNIGDTEVSINTTIGPRQEVEFIGDMWEYQEPAILDFVDRLSHGKTDLILSADTGSGKTVMLIKMWTMLHVPALVIVPKSDLMDQWKKRLLQFTDLNEEDIGIARQDVCQYKDKKIVIGMIHSLCKDKYPEDFKKYFGLVVFDEMHKLGALTFSQVGGMFPAKYRLGATATLRRADGLAKVFWAHLGEEVVSPLKGDQPEPTILVCRYTRSSGAIPYWANSKIKRRGVLFSNLAKNGDRSKYITSMAYQLYESGRQTLVLGERTRQLMAIQRALSDLHGVPEEEVGLYIGSTPQSRRDYIADNCSIILATTSMMGEGTDIPTLRGLVFATPLADVEQPVGRICRWQLNALDPVVVDIVDMKYREAFGWYQGRLKFYDKKGWEVKHV